MSGSSSPGTPRTDARVTATEETPLLASSSDERFRKSALHFVLAIGVVSAFSDMTHEGARSITGPFLGSLGANGAVVSTIAGGGELLGYALRYVSGTAADRSQRYWAITWIGYVLQMAVVPLIALSYSWPVAAVFIVLERVGRAIRTPARDAMTAHAASRLGSGWAFGVREALDAGGAVVGPLIITAITVTRNNNYREGFSALVLPAALCLLSLFVTWRIYPHPSDLEKEEGESTEATRFPLSFWLYLGAMSFIAIGYADWPLIALHFADRQIVRSDLIPALYVAGMGAEAVSSLVLGKLFDLYGLYTVLGVTLLTAAYGPLVLLGNLPTAIVGTIIWGIGMAAQESVIKAVITSIVPKNRRASAFGLFDTGFGIAWFAGSAVLGVLYDRSLVVAAGFTVTMQLVAIPLLLLTQRQLRN